MNFNLSAIAVRERAVTLFFILLLVAAGQSVPASEPSETPATTFEKLWERAQKLTKFR